MVARPELARLMNDLLDLETEPDAFVLTRGHYVLMVGMLSSAQGKDFGLEERFQELSQGVKPRGSIDLGKLEELAETGGFGKREMTAGQMLDWLDGAVDPAWAPHSLFGHPVLVTDQFGGSFAYGRPSVVARV